MQDAVQRTKVDPLVHQTGFLQITGQTNRHQLQQMGMTELTAKAKEISHSEFETKKQSPALLGLLYINTSNLSA